MSTPWEHMDPPVRHPNPDCASRNRTHEPHTLMGPGGNKPGSRCDGSSEPEDHR